MKFILCCADPPSIDKKKMIGEIYLFIIYSRLSREE